MVIRNGWWPGDIIADERKIELRPSDAGNYRLRVGVYTGRESDCLPRQTRPMGDFVTLAVK